MGDNYVAPHDDRPRMDILPPGTVNGFQWSPNRTPGKQTVYATNAPAPVETHVVALIFYFCLAVVTVFWIWLGPVEMRWQGLGVIVLLGVVAFGLITLLQGEMPATIQILTEYRNERQAQDDAAAMYEQYAELEMQKEANRHQEAAWQHEETMRKLDAETHRTRIENDVAYIKDSLRLLQAPTPPVDTFVPVAPNVALEAALDWLGDIYGADGLPNGEVVRDTGSFIVGMPWNRQWKGESFCDDAKTLLTTGSAPLLVRSGKSANYLLDVQHYPTHGKAANKIASQSRGGVG